MFRSLVPSASLARKPPWERSIARARYLTPRFCERPRPKSLINDSRLATSTTLIPAAAICRANSLPIPDEAPVTSAHGPNRSLSRFVFIWLLLVSASFFMSPASPLLPDNPMPQSPDPILKPPRLHHHHIGVVGAVRYRRHTLKDGE